MQLWQYCLLVTERSLTCFGRFLRPSSGVLKTVVAATSACHGSGWYISSKDVQGRLYAALCHSLNRLWHSAVYNRPWTSLLDIYHSDPWHEPVAATTVLVLLMMDAESVRNMWVILQLLINNTAKVASCWFFMYYGLMMHGNSNIKLHHTIELHFRLLKF